MIKEEIWNNFTDKLSKIEMNTFTGVDDPNDPDLGFSFINGYFSFEHLEPNGSSGSLSDYLLTKKKAKRVLIIEIPSNSTQLQKEQIIELVFQDLVPIL